MIAAALTTSVSAQVIANGSLNDLNGTTNPNPSSTTFNSTAASSWSNFSGSADWYNPNPTGSPGNTWDLSRGVSASPDGGAFMSARVNERFGQTITGFTAGQKYSLSFLSTNAGNGTSSQNSPTVYTTSGFWDVTLLGQTLSSSTRSWQGVGNQTWTLENLVFTANTTGSSQLVICS